MIKIYKTFASVLVSLFAVYFVFSTYDLNLPKILLQFQSIDYRLAILSLVMFFGANYLNAVRMRSLVAKQEIYYSDWIIFKFGLVQSFFYSFFPGGVLSDLVRISLLIQERKQAYTIFKVSFLDRVYGLAGVVFCFIGLLLCGGDFAKLAFFSVLAGIGTFVYHQRSTSSYINQAIYAVLISIVTMLIAGYSLHLGTSSLDISLGFVTVLQLSLISTISATVPSINGIGVRDFLYILLFGSVLSNETAVVISTIVLILNTIMGLFGGVILIFHKQFGIALNSRLIQDVREEIQKGRKFNFRV